MYILYADDAGNTGVDYDNKRQPIFSLSGVIVDTNKWDELNSLITQSKLEIVSDYPNCELHATDIYNGKKCKNGSFNFRRYSLEENLEILEKLVQLIVKIRLKIITFIVRKENLKRYCKNRYGSAIKIDPYLIAFPYITLFFDQYLIQKNTNGLIFLDNQSDLVSKVDKILNKLRLMDGFDFIDIKIAKVIEKALFLDSSKSNFIQLADICNFYINRYKSMEYGVIPKEPKATHIEKMYKLIEPLILPPAKNPSELQEMLIFFEDNKDIFQNK